MLEDLKKTIVKEQSKGKKELIAVCGVNAYDELSKEIPFAMTNKCKEVLGVPIYCLDWIPTDQILLGGKALLIPPYEWKEPKKLDTTKLPVDILEQIRRYQLPDEDLFPVISQTPPKFKTIIKDTTEEYITQACFELKIDPNILQNQSLELVKQKNLIENTAEMLKNGKLFRRPCALGTAVYIVENAKMHQGSVVRYEQVLSPKRDIELLFADIEISGLNIIVRRLFQDFGKTVFVDSEDAKNKLKEQISNK